MVMSAIATATIPAATSSTRTMLPLRRAGSLAAFGSRDGSLSGSAVIRRDAACRRENDALARMKNHVLAARWLLSA